MLHFQEGSILTLSIPCLIVGHRLNNEEENMRSFPVLANSDELSTLVNIISM